MFALNSYTRIHACARMYTYFARIITIVRARAFERECETKWHFDFTYILCRYRVQYPSLSFLRPVNKQYSPDSGDIIINEVCLVYLPTLHCCSYLFSCVDINACVRLWVAHRKTTEPRTNGTRN